MDAFELLGVCFNQALVILSLRCLLEGVNKTVPGEKEKWGLGKMNLRSYP